MKTTVFSLNICILCPLKWFKKSNQCIWISEMNDKFYSQSLHFSSRFSGTNLKLQFLLWRGYVWVIVGINRKLWSLNTVLARGEVQASLLPYVQRDRTAFYVMCCSLKLNTFGWQCHSCFWLTLSELKWNSSLLKDTSQPHFDLSLSISEDTWNREVYS